MSWLHWEMRSASLRKRNRPYNSTELRHFGTIHRPSICSLSHMMLQCVRSRRVLQQGIWNNSFHTDQFQRDVQNDSKTLLQIGEVLPGRTSFSRTQQVAHVRDSNNMQGNQAFIELYYRLLSFLAGIDLASGDAFSDMVQTKPAVLRPLCFPLSMSTSFPKFDLSNTCLNLHQPP